MQSNPESKLCPRCGRDNRCGIGSSPETCWCMKLPRLLVVPKAESTACLCKDCLTEVILQAKPKN